MPDRLTLRQEEALRRLRAGANADLIRYFLMFGGSRSGKTYLNSREINIRAHIAPGSRHLIVRKEAVSCKQSVASDTWRKVWANTYEGEAAAWGFHDNFNKTDGLFLLPPIQGRDQSEVWFSGLNDQNLDRILGREFATIYMVEASEMSYDSFTTLESRLAQVVQRIDPGTGRHLGALTQRFLVDLNPTVEAHWTYKLFVKKVNPETDEPLPNPEKYDYITVNPTDNEENLDPAYLESLRHLPARKKKRFYEGRYQADRDDALWHRSYFKRVRKEDLPEMRRIVVSVDPPATSGPAADECGITVEGVCFDGFGYVLEDISARMRPEQWARRALAAHRSWKADCIVAEVNNGGEMVAALIRSVEMLDGGLTSGARIKQVRATRGKVMRAEPISALYERGLVYHCENMATLEDQMCALTPGFDRDSEGWSPDRVDSVVWGFTELHPLLTKKRNPQDDEEEEAEEGAAGPPPPEDNGWLGI